MTNSAFETISCEVCGKPKETSGERCHATLGQTNMLCKAYGCCRIEEKTDEQFAYVRSATDRNVFLNACPGSGKTEVVGLKAAYEMNRWTDPQGGIAVLSFTNKAADTITERALQFMGEDKIFHPHTIRTFDSWLQSYIFQPFAHITTNYAGKDGDRSVTVVSDAEDAPFLKGFTSKTAFWFASNPNSKARTFPIYANTIAYDSVAGDLSIRHPFNGYYIKHLDYFSTPGFETFKKKNAWMTVEKLSESLWEAKSKFWEAGFCTYDDVECLCHDLLQNNDNVRKAISDRFPLIIIDESQDLSPVQLEILRCLSQEGTVLHFIGDLGQAIYGFRDVYPEKIREFISDSRFLEMPLTSNFRSCQDIVDACVALTEGKQSIEGKAEAKVSPACHIVQYNGEANLNDLPGKFSEIIGGNCSKADSCIIGRGWSLLRKIQPGANAKWDKALLLPAAIYLWKSGKPEDIRDALECMGKFLGRTIYSNIKCNPRHYYKPDVSDSPAHWRQVLAMILDAVCKSDTLSDLTRSWKDWADDIRKQLPQLLATYISKPDGSSIDSISFRAMAGKSAMAVLNTLKIIESTSSDIPITTIHGVKGLTKEAIMLVSSPDKKSQGGHWAHWLDPTSGNGEHARFAYVASSRPKWILVWAVPVLNDGEKKALEELGFTIADHAPKTGDVCD